MSIKSVKMKISKNKKMRFFLMSQGSLDPKIRFLGQKVSSVAWTQTDTQTDRHESEYRGQPFRVSGIFSSTYHRGSVQYRSVQSPYNLLVLTNCISRQWTGPTGDWGQLPTRWEPRVNVSIESKILAMQRVNEVTEVIYPTQVASCANKRGTNRLQSPLGSHARRISPFSV